MADKDDQVKKPNRFRRMWTETIGELRKVSWPTIPEARRLAMIVLIVMFSTGVALGLIDWVFSRIITALLG